MVDQRPADSPLRDVDHVVLEPPAVRPAGEVVAEHAEPVALADRRRRRDRQVEPQLVGERRPGVVELRRLETRAEDCHEIGSVRLLERSELRIQLVQQRRERRSEVVLLELLVVRRRGGVPLVLQLRRDEQLVDQRVAETRHLHPVRLPLALVDLETRPVGGGPHADHVRRVVEHRDGHL